MKTQVYAVYERYAYARMTLRPGLVVAMPVIPAFRKLRQEAMTLEASLGYRVRLLSKEKRKKKRLEEASM